jgi:hypothetical protein
MPSFKLAAACLRHGALCALASISLLSAPHARASTLTPAISGTPPAAVAAGQYYAFTPSVSGPRGYPLTFSISGKPGWAGFNRVSGQLLGTPTAGSVGRYGNIVITVSDGVASASLPAFSITVSSSSAAAAPTISGSPLTSIVAGQYYAFTPKASGSPLSYSISGKPAWAGFNRVSGQLLGTPTAADVGKYSNIIITVSNGLASASLAPFSITVDSSGSQLPPAPVTVSWMPPTTNTNGSTLTNLAGYHLYYGTSQSNLNQIVNITNPGLSSYVLSNLAAGTWYFAMTSINTSGVEGPRSGVLSHVVQ